MIRLSAVLIALIFLAGCGSDNEGDSGGATGGQAEVELEGHEFDGKPVTGQELVPDSKLTISFEEGRIAVNASCNNMAAPYEVTDGDRLKLTGPMVSTMMGCPKPLQRQDEWLVAFFETSPEVVALQDGVIALRGEAVEIQMTPR